MNPPESRWSAERGDDRRVDYDERWRRLAAAGESIHGEADFVCRFEPTAVLDAGCGTGRVAIELAVRGIDVVGVDLDPTMLDQARTKAPDLTWIEASIADVAIDRTFDVIVMAGNVMLFVEPGSESAVVANLARHLAPDGHLVSGFQVGPGYDLDRYDADCASAGLTRFDRFATWNGDDWREGGDYAVTVHRN